MTKSKFLIYTAPTPGTKAFKPIEGYMYLNRGWWVGIHKTHSFGDKRWQDGTEVWAISLLSMGLRYGLYRTRKEATEVAKSAEMIKSLPGTPEDDSKTGRFMKDLCGEMKAQYEKSDDPELAKTYWKMYGGN